MIRPGSSRTGDGDDDEVGEGVGDGMGDGEGVGDGMGDGEGVPKCSRRVKVHTP